VNIATNLSLDMGSKTIGNIELYPTIGTGYGGLFDGHESNNILDLYEVGNVSDRESSVYHVMRT
jgi:hypothetical protein